MRVGFVVDGECELRGMRPFLDRIDANIQVVKILKADLQPYAKPGRIVFAAESRLKILRTKGADKAVVLLDLENRNECPGRFASNLEQEFKRKLGSSVLPVSVVVKCRCLENWLISDPRVLKHFPERFSRIPKHQQSRIVPNQADSIDALAVLKKCARGNSYSKIEDSKIILSKLDPLSGAMNSRSLRRLLRILQSFTYSTQSVAPAKSVYPA